MPRSKKKTVEETPVVVLEKEVQEVVEVVPKKLYVEVRQEFPMPQYNTVGAVPVGTMTYYESTEEFKVTSEVEFEEYMIHLSKRVLRLTDGTMVDVSHRKEWMENFSKNTFDAGVFAKEVRVSNENE